MEKKSKSTLHKAVSQVVSRKSSGDNILTKRGYFMGNYLGEGSYSQVYVAEYTDPNIKRSDGKTKVKLACKVVNTSELSKDFQEKFFPREMAILNEVRHPNVVRVHSILKRKHIYYVFMEFAENGDLLHFIMTNGAVRENQSRVWFLQILRGLRYLHDRNIAHRDMKCENLLLTTGYSIKITDFGFARYCTNLPDGSPVLSQTYCGSVTYVAPEVLRGDPYDPKIADLWSLGIILYIMLNKAWPFDPTVPKRLYEAQMTRNWKIRSKVINELSTEVKNFVTLLLEPDPKLRLSLDAISKHPWFLVDLGNEVIAPKEKVKTDIQTQSQQTGGPNQVINEIPSISETDRKSEHEPNSESVQFIKTTNKEGARNADTKTILVPRSKTESNALDPQNDKSN